MWQPIETAPHDHSWVLLLCPGLEEPSVFVAQWVIWDDPVEGSGGEWSEYHEYNLECDPTHWAALPASPVA